MSRKLAEQASDLICRQERRCGTSAMEEQDPKDTQEHKTNGHPGEAMT